MTDIKNIKSVYFLGIGGIGMSALARYFKNKGMAVSGYDRTETELTIQLIEEGIPVHYEDDLSLADKNANMVVYTPAIPAGHSEMEFFKREGYPLFKRSEVLGMVTADTFNICIAGTHGKTTTSTMIAHILRHSGYGCNAFLGGVSVNYNTNTWSSERNVSVAEADEYDRSFLKLSPDIAVVTSMDPDHLDIYGNEKNMQDAFIEFGKKVKPGGVLLLNKGVRRSDEFIVERKLTYSYDDKNTHAYSSNVRAHKGRYLFDVIVGDEKLDDVELNMGGRHNIENAVACIAISKDLKIGDEKIKSAVADFAGIRRRFEYVVKTEKKVLIDDYAHHPEELRALITGAKELFPGLKCTVVFQPHLFTRTRDLAKGFGEVLGLADEVILLPVYPARELPIEGVTSAIIMNSIRDMKKEIVEKNTLADHISRGEHELLIMAGAGDIDTLVQPVKAVFE